MELSHVAMLQEAESHYLIRYCRGTGSEHEEAMELQGCVASMLSLHSPPGFRYIHESLCTPTIHIIFDPARKRAGLPFGFERGGEERWAPRGDQAKSHVGVEPALLRFDFLVHENVGLNGKRTRKASLIVFLAQRVVHCKNWRTFILEGQAGIL